MAEHTSSQFNMELENVRTQVMKMGGLLEKQLLGIIHATATLDGEDLPNIVVKDAQIDQMEVSIDDECQLIIARRQPAASDLRLVLTVTRIITDLERIGDEIKKVALHTHELIDGNRVNVGQLYDVNRMCEMALTMLKKSLDAFARVDPTTFIEIAKTDDQLDQEYSNQLRKSITFMMEDTRNIGVLMDILFMYKSIERMGDHALNITEHVVYLANGIDIRHHSRDEASEKIIAMADKATE